MQIVCALWQRPDVLVMDEPTSDLDAATKRVMADALAQSKVAKRYDGRFRDYGAAASTKTLVHLDEGELYAGEFSLEIPELWIDPHDHIVLSGNNGCGKSLLIREVVGHVHENAKVAYIAQEVDTALRKTALERLECYDSQRCGQILSLVGSLNSDPKRLADGTDISPGELKKLLLAEQLIEDPHLLILDEPINHLDLGSIEALAELLVDFPGTFLLVTHDRALQETVAKSHWLVEREEDRCRLNID